MSFGFAELEEALEAALNIAFSEHKIVFAAASNNGTLLRMTFPALYPTVICMNSASGLGNSSHFNPSLGQSRVGKNLSIIGENVESAWQCGPKLPATETTSAGKLVTIPTEYTERKSGTSVATPIAAGVAALVLEFVFQSLATPSKSLDSGVFDSHTFNRLKKLGVFKNQQMEVILRYMSRLTISGSHFNITPWNLLDGNEKRADIARDIEKVLKENFK
jgi:hypothetical protein